MVEFRKIGVIMSAFLFVGMSFGTMIDNARSDPVMTISNEVMFYDHFSITDGLDKWECDVEPVTNKCEKTANNPIGSHWNSWFLAEDGQLHLFSDPAYPTGEAWAESLPYPIVQDYVINLHFRLVANSYFKVVDDGYVLLTVEDDDLFAYDGLTKVLLQDDIGYDWNLIEIRVHLSAENYDVYLGRDWIDRLDFASSSPRYQLVLGDDNDISVYPNMHGRGDWDNIIVAYLHPQTWSDNFNDDDIRDWTKVVSPTSFFDTWHDEYYSPEYSLRMAQPGEVVYGFTPYYDIARNHDYTTQFYFRIPNYYSTEMTVVADGNVRIILTGTTLKAYVSETDIRSITSISMNYWHSILIDVHSIPNIYEVTVDDISRGYFPFVDEIETEFIRATSQMFVGEHRHVYTGTEAFWDDQHIISNNPELDWCGTPGFTDDGVNPNSGDTRTKFEYCVKYSDPNNDPPSTGDPEVHIKKSGTEIISSPFEMKFDSWVSGTNDYVAGARYKYTRTLDEAGTDYTYYFTAYDDQGFQAIPTPELDAPYVSVPPSETWWMFLHDLEHREYSTDAAPSTNNIAWSKTDSHDSIKGTMSSPAVGNGNVYIGSDSHWFYAFDIGTGGLSWETMLGGPIESSPAIIDGRVFVGANGSDNRMYSLDAGNGNIQWEFPTGAGILSSPAVYDGKVYFGSRDGNLYCVDQIGNPPLKQTNLLWKFETGGVGVTHQILSSPAIADDMVFFIAYDSYLYALDATPDDGSDDGIPDPGSPNYDIIWKTWVNPWTEASPTVANGKVFIGTDTAGLIALDESDGKILWTFEPSGDSFETSVAIHGGAVFLNGITWNGGAYNAVVYKLDENGNVIWKYTGLHEIGSLGEWSSPAIADGKVYVKNLGWLMALDEIGNPLAQTTWLLWESNIEPGYDGDFESSPAVDDGYVFVGTSFHNDYSGQHIIYAFHD